MEKSTKGDFFVATLISASLACLFTGGLAAFFNFSIPITAFLTIGVVFAIAYGSAEE